jgi:hypothetical protein
MVAKPPSRPSYAKASEGKKGPAFSFERKVGVLLVLILGVGGIILGSMYTWQNLRRPFYDVLYYSGESMLPLAQREAAEIEAQKDLDTDGDTLSDYDELYVFKTSPYLTDSDSDGQDDAEEIAAGLDPNCPTGQECGYYFASADNNTSAQGIADNLPGSNLDFSNVDMNDPESLTNYFASMTADQVRDILLDAGVAPESLEELTDQEIMALLDGAVQKSTDIGGLIEDIEN